jgi:hypothetical protein
MTNINNSIDQITLNLHNLGNAVLQTPSAIEIVSTNPKARGRPDTTSTDSSISAEDSSYCISMTEEDSQKSQIAFNKQLRQDQRSGKESQKKQISNVSQVAPQTKLYWSVALKELQCLGERVYFIILLLLYFFINFLIN